MNSANYGVSAWPAPSTETFDWTQDNDRLVRSGAMSHCRACGRDFRISRCYGFRLSEFRPMHRRRRAVSIIAGSPATSSAATCRKGRPDVVSRCNFLQPPNHFRKIAQSLRGSAGFPGLSNLTACPARARYAAHVASPPAPIDLIELAQSVRYYEIYEIYGTAVRCMLTM